MYDKYDVHIGLYLSNNFCQKKIKITYYMLATASRARVEIQLHV